MKLELQRMVRPTPSNEDISFPVDVTKMRAAMNRLGYDATDADIQAAYEEFSAAEDSTWQWPGDSAEAYEWAAKKAIEYLVAPRSSATPSDGQP